MQFLQHGRIQVGSTGLQVTRGHAGGSHQLDVQVGGLAAFVHEDNALDAANIGNLVGIGHDCGDASGRDRPAEFSRCAQAALDMDMRVDQAGGNGQSLAVDGVRALIVGCDACDETIGHRDVRFLEPAGEDIEDAPVGQHQVRCGFAAGDCGQVLETGGH